MTMTNQHAMQDPTKQYDKPPFETEMQLEPGLAKDMTPKPDHGETSYKGSERLKGRKALITGGDSGIGRAAAIAIAREGADIVLSYLPDEQADADEVIALLTGEGHKVLALPGDISDEAFCKELVEFAAENLGGIDILANVAGKQVSQEDIADITTEQFDATMKVNVYALFWICKYTIPYMPEGGSIINTASIQSYQPSGHLLDYASTKAAITAFSQALAKQVIDKGIRVNIVAPGPIWTPLQPSQGQQPEALKDFGTQTPMQRPGQPAEVAPAYVFFASQESSYITAESLGVTGGQHLP